MGILPHLELVIKTKILVLHFLVPTFVKECGMIKPQERTTSRQRVVPTRRSVTKFQEYTGGQPELPKKDKKSISSMDYGTLQRRMLNSI